MIPAHTPYAFHPLHTHTLGGACVPLCAHPFPQPRVTCTDTHTGNAKAPTLNSISHTRVEISAVPFIQAYKKYEEVMGVPTARCASVQMGEGGQLWCQWGRGQ